MKTLALEEAQIVRLLTYLEYLSDTGKSFETEIIKEDVAALVTEITKQTGITLNPIEIVTRTHDLSAPCTHQLVSAKGWCALCGSKVR